MVRQQDILILNTINGVEQAMIEFGHPARLAEHDLLFLRRIALHL
jgi:hypothetical protein